MIDIWQLGNTGVRNPMRMQDALRVYADSNLIGKIRGVSGCVAFMNLLHEKGVLVNQIGRDVTGSYGRKWRLVFNQNGFTYSQNDIGPVDSITPFGKSFLEATTTPAIQECFLRSMSMMMFPIDGGAKAFSGLRWTLAVMLDIERKTGDNSISFIEFATHIQTSNPDYDIEKVVSDILNLRADRIASAAKKVFDRKYYEEIGMNYPHKCSNFREYGDMNLRYLRATGIVRSKGNGIVIVDEKHELAELLAKNIITNESQIDRLKRLSIGPMLPTDDIQVAKKVLNGLECQLKAKGICYTVDRNKLLSAADINNVRRHLEGLLTQNAEELYAIEQKNKWSEIADYMDLVVRKGGTKSYGDDYEIKVPKEEASAYMEWCLWRALLAMNALVNKPYKVRRFNVDQDFMPINTAPGNGPDLIAEYKDFTLVVEVTLSDSSRQEAMEGEPVRRHVFDLRSTNKPVLGLFIANNINTNTAETFRVGTWYDSNDLKSRLDIVPVPLKVFHDYFVSVFKCERCDKHIMNVLSNCIKKRDQFGAPEWKAQIVNEFDLGCNSDGRI